MRGPRLLWGRSHGSRVHGRPLWTWGAQPQVRGLRGAAGAFTVMRAAPAGSGAPRGSEMACGVRWPVGWPGMGGSRASRLGMGWPSRGALPGSPFLGALLGEPFPGALPQSPSQEPSHDVLNPSRVSPGAAWGCLFSPPAATCPPPPPLAAVLGPVLLPGLRQVPRGGGSTALRAAPTPGLPVALKPGVGGTHLEPRPIMSPVPPGCASSSMCPAQRGWLGRAATGAGRAGSSPPQGHS